MTKIDKDGNRGQFGGQYLVNTSIFYFVLVLS
jgi:hypothetical protein